MDCFLLACNFGKTETARELIVRHKVDRHVANEVCAGVIFWYVLYHNMCVSDCMWPCRYICIHVYLCYGSCTYVCDMRVCVYV